MATAFETLKQKQSTTTDNKASAFDKLKQKTVGLSETIQSEKKPQGFLSEIGNALTQSEQNLGQDIGRGILGGDKYFNQITDQYTKNVDTLTKLAAKQTDPALKQKYLDMAKSDFEEGQKVGVDFKGRSWEQIAGDVLGTALDIGTTLTGLGAVKALKGATTAQKVAKGALTGAKYGTAYGLIGGLQENKDVLGVAGQGLVGGALGGATGGALSYAGVKAGQVIGNLAEKRANKVADLTKQGEKLAGVITQGEKGEQKISNKVLSKLDTTGVKTQEDLSNVLNKKLDTLNETQNIHLSQDKTKFKPKQLNVTIKSGETEIKHNFVKDAIQQLKDFYTKTNDQLGLKSVKEVETQMSKNGLTTKNINDIAKVHGGRLNAYNASGELASGLTKQAAENTRAGLKETVRQLSEISGKGRGGISKSIDREITNTIKVKDLIDIQKEAVNKLQQKIQKPGIIQKVGGMLGTGLDLATKNALSSFLRTLQGFKGTKTLNAIDLEKTLAKNLGKLQKLNEMIDKGANKDIIMSFLKELSNKEIGGLKIGNRLPEIPIAGQSAKFIK